MTALTKQLSDLFSFHGGIKVDSHKRHDAAKIQSMPVPERLFLPLTQHIGQPSIAVVNVGDQVFKGQVIADLDEHPVSARIHAPTSGVIESIEDHEVPHPSGLRGPCIVIRSDGMDTWMDHNGAKDPAALNSREILTYIENAGIVGLGGAVFPTAVKLDNHHGIRIDTLIINGAECEPYISCDEALMTERAAEVVLGARLIQRVLNATHCIIALEDDIPQAYTSLQQAVKNYNDEHIAVIQVPELYPSGSEKQLITLLTGKEVPAGKIPANIGISCVNVGTAAAVYRAVHFGEPLLSRIVTAAGDAVSKPGNYEVLIGTPVADFLSHCGLGDQRLERLIMGGPMMGFTLQTMDIPIIKATNSLLATAPMELDRLDAAMPCIRCGRCADSCPMNLLPQQMYWYARARDFEKIEQYHIFDCIECGCCSYVCPSNIALVQYYRFAKSEIRDKQRSKIKSDIARERHELREQRLEKIKAEKAEKRKHMQARKKAPSNKPSDSTDNEDPIRAALKRVQEKKAKQKNQDPADKS